MIEICCGSYEDAMCAYQGGAERIELNSALYLGGLTPSLGSLILCKKNTNLKVIAMIRPRGAGFNYSDIEFEGMMFDAKLMLENGADGLAFGFLNSDRTLDIEKNRAMIELIHSYHKEAVFHRAFDCVKNPYTTIETCIELGVDRLLTSGIQAKAMEGIALITELQSRYGTQIEILAGSGMNSSNAKEMMEKSGISQVHSSCKDWKLDVTTATEKVNYSYASKPNETCYEVVSEAKVKELIQSVEY